jgi:hypothetical protein
LITEMETMAKGWENTINSYQLSNYFQSDNFALVDPLVQKASSLIPSEIAIKKDKTLIGNLKSDQMWQDTLNLDTRNTFVKNALDTLENIQWDKNGVTESLTMLVEIAKLSEQRMPEMDYFLGIFCSSPRTYGLAMLTMWHEIPTRYPPVATKDYWKEELYKPEMPLIKSFPFLLKHTKILVDNVYKSAYACSKMQNQNKKRC